MSKIVITTAVTVDGLSESPAPKPYGWMVLASGMGSFARFLVEQDLVDELLFFVNPTIQGPGARPLGGASVDLELLEARQFNTGVALLRYRPHVTGSRRPSEWSAPIECVSSHHD